MTPYIGASAHKKRFARATGRWWIGAISRRKPTAAGSYSTCPKTSANRTTSPPSTRMSWLGSAKPGTAGTRETSPHFGTAAQPKTRPRRNQRPRRRNRKAQKGPMTEVTQILSAIERGDPHAASQLLPLVYDELRRLAAQKLAQESAGQTLQCRGDPDLHRAV